MTRPQNASIPKVLSSRVVVILGPTILPDVTTGHRELPRVEVRLIREEDWESFREVRLRALRSDPLAFGSTLAREEAFPPETWKERTTREKESPNTATWAVVDPEGRFVGLTSVGEFEGAMHLFAMWVDPVRRGMGAGGQLLDAALTWMRRTHAGQTLELDVNPRQAAAVRLYETRGFRRTGKSSPLGHTEGEEVIGMIWEPGGKA
jgi:GNAT superfamily N-acetyltransferase